MRISIENQQKKIPLHPPQISRIAKTVLRYEKVLKACLTIVFVTDPKIKSLNKKFLHRNHTTDVLAFDLTKSVLSRSSHKGKIKEIDGEIFISTTTAMKNAKAYQMDPYQEVILCLIHGILHLLGYDDHSPRDRKQMRRKEKELMGWVFRKIINQQ